MTASPPTTGARTARDPAGTPAPTAPVAGPAPGVPASSAGGTRSFALWVAGIAAVGLAIRLMNVFWWRETTNRPGYLGYRLWGDAFYYHHQANELVDGKFFINPVKYVFDGIEQASAGHPPLYTLYLAFWSLLGVDSVTAHRVVSGLLGVATIVVIAYLGRRLVNPAVGLVAGAIVAVYPFMWINDGMLMAESLAVFMASLVLAAAYAFVKTPGPRQMVWLGLACAGSALTRSELLMLLPLLLVPLALLARSRTWKQRIALAALGCAVAGVTIAPWVAYNMSRFEEPVYLSTGIGHTLQQSACDEVFYGRLIGYYWQCYTLPASADRLDESERDALPREYALDYLDAHKSRIPLVVAARVGRLWGAFKPGQTTAMDWWIEGRGRAASWASTFFYYAMIPFVIVGLVTMWRRKISLVPVLAPAVIVTISAAITFGIPRYRAPAEVGLVLAAAIGIGTAWSAWHNRRRPEPVAAPS
jgi:4-amino-4-deoxy-L-arabinose transferase-like glycosyltransferase